MNGVPPAETIAPASAQPRGPDAPAPMRAPPRRRAGRIERVQDEAIYVLHSYPWKETSLLLDTFSRSHGRVALVAKGAKRPTSALRPVLLGLQPCLAAWSGRGEVRTLTRADWAGGVAPLVGLPLLCGFYFNELLVRLLAREDAHETLFDAYHQAVCALSAQPQARPADVEPILRGFEFALLRELGHLPQFDREGGSGRPVEPGESYRVDPAHGVIACAPGEPDALRGATLLALRDGLPVQPEPGLARAAKVIMRNLLHYHLPGQTLRTRQLLIDLHTL